MPYSIEIPGKVAKAFGNELNISWKDANEICRWIRGIGTKTAKRKLDAVIERRTFVPMLRYNTGVGHREAGQPGRYPIKAARAVKKILENAEANAESRGFDTDKLRIAHSSAYKGMRLQRIRPRGQAINHSIQLTNVEIIVKEN